MTHAEITEALCLAYAGWQKACDALADLPPLSEEAEKQRQKRDIAYWEIMALAIAEARATESERTSGGTR